jgi:hypothetical protein
VAATFDKAGTLDLFSVADDGEVTVRRRIAPSGLWTDWQTLSPPPLPPVVAVSPGALSDVVRVPTNRPLAATGGVGPYTWAFAGLPPGVTGGTNGVLTGTPSTEGTYSVTATVTDSVGQASAVTFAWSIVKATVPNVVGLSHSEATRRVQNAGLGVTSRTVVDCNDVPDRVRSQNPGAGAQVPGLTVVTLIVTALPAGGEACN